MRILLVLVLFVAATSFSYGRSACPKDSLRTERIDGKAIIFHKVEAKETLYSLARRYKTSVGSITALNPNALKSFEIGDIVKVPGKDAALAKTDNSKAEVVRKDETTEVKPAKTNKTPKSSKENDTYTVVQGDNWYSISRKTGVTVPVLKQLNPAIAASGLATGQVLVTKSGATATTTEVAKELTVIKTDKPDLSPTGYEKIVEKGLCEVIEDKDSRLHVALSKTAPEGTIIQIKNELNGRVIFVKVIGKLPDTGANDKVIVKLSYKAFEAIDANAKRFPVVVSYTK